MHGMISREEKTSVHEEKRIPMGDNAETEDALLEEQELNLNEDFETLKKRGMPSILNAVLHLSKEMLNINRMAFILNVFDEKGVSNAGSETSLQTHGFERQHKYVDKSLFKNIRKVLFFTINNRIFIFYMHMYCLYLDDVYSSIMKRPFHEDPLGIFWSKIILQMEFNCTSSHNISSVLVV